MSIKFDLKYISQMNNRRKFTFFYSLVIVISLLLININQNVAQYLYPNPNSYGTYFLPSLDSCNTYLDFLFTVGGIKPGTKIAFSPSDKRSKNGKKSNSTTLESIENDTAVKANRIISIRESEKGDKIQIFIQIENKEQNIKIMIYNLLGKKVLDLYEGQPKDSNQPYEVNTSDLPKGIFLIVVSGENFRLREKLIISR